MTKKPIHQENSLDLHYGSIFGDISKVIDAARRSAARSVNSIMTAAYWLIGRRIVEFEQGGKERAAYGEELLERLSVDLGKCFGRFFSRQNVQQMRQFYLSYRSEQKCQTPSGDSVIPSSKIICQTASGKSENHEIPQTVSAESARPGIASEFPPTWSSYVRLLAVGIMAGK